jgi:hypothetical protein
MDSCPHTELWRADQELDISTAVPNNLQAEIWHSPQLQKGARVKFSTAAFPKMFMSRE